MSEGTVDRSLESTNRRTGWALSGLYRHACLDTRFGTQGRSGSIVEVLKNELDKVQNLT
jgi:hypothetical protein